MAETQTEQQERIAAKIQTAKWNEGVPVPHGNPRLRLSGTDGNAFVIISRAASEARAANWTKEQIDEFQKLAMAGDYDNVLQTCMKYFDVR